MCISTAAISVDLSHIVEDNGESQFLFVSCCDLFVLFKLNQPVLGEKLVDLIFPVA